MLDRINQAEKYLGSTCVQIGKVCRKEARLRDCNDQLVQNMFEFADREKINTTLRQSLQQYASYLSAVEDYRNTLVYFIANQIHQHKLFFHWIDHTSWNTNSRTIGEIWRSDEIKTSNSSVRSLLSAWDVQFTLLLKWVWAFSFNTVSNTKFIERFYVVRIAYLISLIWA